MNAVDSGELLYDIMRFAFAGLLLLFLVQMARIMIREIETSSLEGHESLRTPPSTASLIVVDGGASRLTEGTVIPAGSRGTVGRAAECDIVVDDPSVSSIHAAIFERGGQWFVEDFESMNGTWARGRPIEGETPLQDGDLLQFGRVRMRLLC